MKSLSFDIPLSLAEKLQDSAKESRRSFTQEIVWRLEQSYTASGDANKAIVVQ
jgi:hypothetical protein